MINGIVHLEIPAPDPAKASAFYASVFGWSVKTIPNEKDYAYFRSADLGGGFNANAKPTADGTVAVIQVEDIPRALERIAAAGGRMTTPKTAIPDGSGHYAYFSDCCGNRLGLYAER
jgi:predicted enzyme related to lactoylglutathione lyase